MELVRREATVNAITGHLDVLEQGVSTLATVATSLSRRLQPEVLSYRDLVSALGARLENRHILRVETQRDRR